MGIIWNIILGVSALLLLREVYIYFRLQKYRKDKKSHVMYIPSILQILGAIISSIKGDIYKDSRVLFSSEEVIRSDLLVLNHYIKTQVLVFIKSERAIKEFYRQEVTHTRKTPHLLDDTFFGFFFVHGQKGANLRSRFSKIFVIENIKRLIPTIRTSVQSHLNKWKREVKSTKNLKLKLKEDIFIPMFKDLSSRLIFGLDNKDMERMEGKTIVENVKIMIDSSFRVSFNLLNVLTAKLPEKFELIPEMKTMKNARKLVKNGIAKMYNQRETLQGNNKKDETVLNLLDLIIEYNNSQKDENEKMDMKEIADNFGIFIFAANDTSMQASTSLLSFLAQNRKILGRLVEEIDEIKDDYDFDFLEDFEYLTAVFKETLRLTPPAGMLSERQVVKDMKICGNVVKKGDAVVVPFFALGMDPETFKEPMKFEPKRFMKNRNKKDFPEISRMQQLPFSYGPRGCIGKVLAEVTVKIIIIEFLKIFDLEILENWKPMLSMGPAYGVQNAEFNLKLCEMMK